jgi:hypothetical protein
MYMIYIHRREPGVHGHLRNVVSGTKFKLQLKSKNKGSVF